MVEAVSAASAKSQTITLTIPPVAEPGWTCLPIDKVQSERRNKG
jgi:hypothetical protein